MKNSKSKVQNAKCKLKRAKDEGRNWSSAAVCPESIEGRESKEAKPKGGAREVVIARERSDRGNLLVHTILCT
jgi:hypothetical protein